MSSPFNPWSARSIHRLLTEILNRYATLSDEQRNSGEHIDPDQPIVLRVPNPEYDGDLHEPEEKYLFFHIQSIGGGGQEDEDGTEIGHAGIELGGMEIDDTEFLFNGRRR